MVPFKRNVLLVTLKIFIPLFLFSAIRCQTKNNYEEIDFNKRTTPEGMKNTSIKNCQILRMSIASIVSAQESFSMYDQFISYIEQKLPYNVKMTYCKKYRDVYQLFEKNQVDIAFICSALYIIGKRKNIFKLLAVPVVNGKSTYQAYIIVPKTSSIQHFEALNGKYFAFTDELSLTGYFYPIYRGNEKITWDNFLFSGSHDNSIQLVNKGAVDGASVDGLVFDDIEKRYPKRVENVRIIEKSEEFGIPPVVMSTSCTHECIRKIRMVFINMDSDSIGQKILHSIGIQKYELPDEELYNEVSKVVPKDIRP